MNFTFGVLTDGKNNSRLEKIFDSIICQKIPNYEILVIGPNSNELSVNEYFGHKLIHKQPIDYAYICFDDKVGWITRKKNILAKNSQHENLVLLHDYVSLDDGWYEGFKEFGGDWDVCMTRVENLDGSRFRDWCICDDPQYCHPYNWDAKIAPYEYDKTWWMYISGAYIITKIDFLLKNPFNENLFWGQGEDVEWSKRIRHKWNYKLNLNSKAKLLKQQEQTLSILESL